MVLSSLITNVGSSVFEIASAESAINYAAIISATNVFRWLGCACIAAQKATRG
jgi:hypothetical protein